MHPVSQTSQSLDGIRCLCSHGAVINSIIEDIHWQNRETHCISGYEVPGPLLISNNFLSASSIGVLFGGADARRAELLPQDITITRNHFYKRPEWKTTSLWVYVKNHLELKTGKRVLVSGNIFENNWFQPSDQQQSGFSIVLWSANQNGGAPFSETAHVTIVDNIIRNSREFHNGFFIYLFLFRFFVSFFFLFFDFSSRHFFRFLSFLAQNEDLLQRSMTAILVAPPT